MNFNELKTAVDVITRRPDLVAETQQAILSATFNLHAADDWWPDRVQAIIPASQFTRADGIAVVLLDDHLPRLRRIESIRPFDALSDPTGYYSTYPPMEEITPDALFDEFGSHRRYYYYLAGANVVMKTTAANSSHVAVYWQYPLAVSPVQYASWIATKYPFAIINKAAVNVLTGIGFEEAAARITKVDCAADMQYLRQNFIANR